MTATLSKPLSSPFFRAGPPQRADRAKLAKPAAIAESVDRIALSQQAKALEPKENGLQGTMLKALTALSVLSAFAGPAMAQAAPGMAPLAHQTVERVVETASVPSFADSFDLSVDTLPLREERMEILSDTTKTKVGVRFDSVNDFMPGSWTSWLGGPQHKTPDGLEFDDDGWTAEIQLESNFQRGNKETVVGARLAMITQPGSRAPFAPDYQGLRTDVAELVAQRNTRMQFGEKATFDYGFGGGLQAIGNVGGESVQRFWHEHGTGGRVGDDLQGNQVTNSFRVMPMVTAGAKLTYNLTDNVNAIVGSQASVPFGRGLGNIGFRAGLGTQRGPFSVEVGGKLDATWSGAPELSFHDPTGIREGLYAKVEYEPGKFGAFYTQLETGGLRNEPVLSIGFRIGGGRQSRLSPFW